MRMASLTSDLLSLFAKKTDFLSFFYVTLSQWWMRDISKVLKSTAICCCFGWLSCSLIKGCRAPFKINQVIILHARLRSLAFFIMHSPVTNTWHNVNVTETQGLTESVEQWHLSREIVLGAGILCIPCVRETHCPKYIVYIIQGHKRMMLIKLHAEK